MAAKITAITHPEYMARLPLWQKYRLVADGGDQFLKEYLAKFSADETEADFTRRRKMTPITSHAKAALADIKNAIYQRMVDIRRIGGPASYREAILGNNYGVDRHSKTLNAFIGMDVIPDLLSLGKVGVLVERPRLRAGATVAEANANPPYLVVYPAEDIKSWTTDEAGRLKALLLLGREHVLDAEYGLSHKVEEVYRYYARTENGVLYREFRNTAKKGISYQVVDETVLDLEQIPFVTFTLRHSLLEDVANHQIALLNMASADVDFTIRINFPFYTEQVDPAVAIMNMRANSQIQYDADQETTDQDTLNLRRDADNSRKVRTGLSRGRTYPKGLERPGFISPPTDPLAISIEKEKQLAEEIRQLINLSLSTIVTVRASAESKDYDNRGLEAGLSWIGQELERGEREIARIWSEYESSDDYAQVTYPHNYSLRTDDQRISLAKEIMELMPKFVSKTVQRELVKEAASLVIAHRVSPEAIDDIRDEIDGAQIVAIDPGVIREDAEAGFIGTELASTSRGYPAGEAEKAKKDHAERLARIQAAQIKPTQGLPDTEPDQLYRDDQKAGSQNSDLTDDGRRAVRGDTK